MNRLGPSTRLHQCPIPLYAVTGGIASGKSYFCSILEELGEAVVYADKLIHTLYEKKPVIDWLKKNAPEVIGHKKIEFPKLREMTFQDPKFRTLLEERLYSLMPEAFLAALTRFEQKRVFYEIPLLFEKNLQEKVDGIICVTSGLSTQRERLKERDGSSPEVIEAIIASQFDSQLKERASDFIVKNELGTTKEQLEIQAREILEKLSPV